MSLILYQKSPEKVVMKTSVKTDVDSIDSVDGRRPRSTVDQFENLSLVDVDHVKSPKKGHVV